MGSLLLKRSKTMLNKSLFHDVTFLFGEEKGSIEKIKAHKYILSVSSPVFHSLFIEKESGDKVPVRDVSPDIFKLLLRYIYTNEDPSIDADNWAPILYASDKYELSSLKEKCLAFVEANCDVGNALQYFIRGKNHRVSSLVPFVKSQVGCNAERAFSGDYLLEIQDQELLAEFLSLDELDCDEIVIFKEALRWAGHQIGEDNTGTKLREALGPAFYEIRFPILTPEEFNSKVVPTGILTDEEIISILTKKGCQFKSGSRMRSCKRFLNVYRSMLRTKLHILRFKVNHKVKINGFGLYMPYQEKQTISGKMILKEESENERVLNEKSFQLEYDSGSNIGYVNYVNSVSVEPNTWYSAVLELDKVDVKTRVGMDGKSIVDIDGIQWTLNNHKDSSETTVLKGQLPIIKFSKLD